MADAFVVRPRIQASSAHLGWPGIVVEKGSNDGWEADQMIVPKHHVAINLSSDPLVFEAVVRKRPRSVVMPPGTLLTCAAGDEVTHRVAGPSSYGTIAIDPERLDRALGVQVRLERLYGIQDPALAHVVRALIAETELGGPNGWSFVDALATALAVRLARAFGVLLDPAKPGRISAPLLHRVFDLVEARLERGVTLEEMAREVGVSPYHFARAFKRTTGTTPHQFLIARRLERARQAVERGIEPLSSIARRLGFADQSHFTRLFRRRFGITPAALRR